jgi:hypothetical protein
METGGTMENGNTIKCMGMVSSNGQMDESMKDFMRMIKSMGKESSTGELVRKCMPEAGKRGSSMEKEFFAIRVENKRLASGWKAKGHSG